MASVSAAPGSNVQPRPAGSKAAALPCSTKQGSTAARDDDARNSISSTAMRYPMANPFMQMQNPFFAVRSFLPMMPFAPMMVPGMVPAAASKSSSTTAGSNSNSKGSTISQKQQMPMMPPMFPMMPPCFPHPAQVQAMTAAAQAAMAQASKTGMPFPPGMMLPPCMFPMHCQQQQQAALAASSKVQTNHSSLPASACTAAGAPPAPVAAGSPTHGAATAADTASDDDDDVTECRLDENVEVDAETEQLFEKVAAMEREKQATAQALRADSPCPSIHSACTGHPSSHPGSPTHTAAAGTRSSDPVSAAVFEEAASLAPAAAGAAAAADAVPVPWLSFAADDGVDDIDKDLAQIITLPDTHVAASTAAAAGAVSGKGTAGPGAANRVPAAMKRIGSVDSAISTGDALGSSVAAAVAGTSCGATASPGAQTAAARPKSKLIKIKTTRGPAATPSAAAKNSSSSKASKSAKYPASKASNSRSCSQQKSSTVAAAALGTAKAGVQKKSNSSSNSLKKSKGKAAAAAKAAKSTPAKPQPVRAPAEEPCLSLLDELHSSLSDTCFGVGSNTDDMAIDSFEYLGGLLQEASDEDAWDGMLTTATVGAADDMELCSVLQA